MGSEIDRRAARGLCAFLVCEAANNKHVCRPDLGTWRYCERPVCEADDLLCLDHHRDLRGPEIVHRNP